MLVPMPTRKAAMIPETVNEHSTIAGICLRKAFPACVCWISRKANCKPSASWPALFSKLSNNPEVQCLIVC